ncbi:MAG: hypothetical protein EOM59_11035 [Clostridia bacterium]|nr:hypothetical protein [Clostridia bacterium]
MSTAFYRKAIKLSIFLLLIALMVLIASGCSTNSPGQASELSISGVIFLDENANGAMDSGEEGIPDVVVKSQSEEAQTNAQGEFELNTAEGEDEISVQANSLPEGLVLTTGNATQSFTISKSAAADPIGYASQDAGGSSYVFEDMVTSKSPYNNYYFELLITNSNQPDSSMKLWVIDNNMKAETQGMVTYYNEESGTMGVYTAATNQVVITPIMEAMPILTPFTFVEELDPNTFEKTMFKGEEVLDGKDVLVFENAMPGFEAKYYIWKGHQIIIKMETQTGNMGGGFYFKDLSLDTVTMQDITYPAGAEILDLS